jgi:hypothetical protein
MKGIRAKQACAVAAVFALASISAGSALAEGRIDSPLPVVHTTLTATPAPIPAPSEGRVPVSLRLADTVSTDDGSHPPAAAEIRFELDRQLRLDLSGVPRCPWASIHSYPAFDWSICKPAIVAGGRIGWEVAFPEREAFQAGGETTVYRGNRNKLLIRTYVSAPISSEIVIPIALSLASEGRYGLSATASIAGLAGGSGSLTYLGLRFRKGLFSAACPKRRLQFGVTDTFADGTEAGGGLIITC